MSEKQTINVRPNLLSVQVLYKVCQYLRQDIPLSALRDWQVGMYITKQNLSSADQYFLQMFEGRYAELSDLSAEWRPGENKEHPEWLFRQQLHELIGGIAPDLADTGTASANYGCDFQRATGEAL